jgi:AcrR family transcriptional regulator
MMGTDAKETKEATSERRDAITDAATGVFLRYGYKKTSMDDLARAAGLSRQGLYLHFKAKEALFTAALLRLASQIQAAARAAIDRDDLDLEERLLGAFEAFQGHAIGTAGSQSINELLETATSLGGRLVHEMEQDLVNSVAGLLTRTGVAAGWKEAGISAHDLAEHLYATSTGLTHTATTPTAYRTRMRTAVKIVTSGTHT